MASGLDLDAYLERIGATAPARPGPRGARRAPPRALRGDPVREPRHPARPRDLARPRRPRGEAGARAAGRLLLRAEHPLPAALEAMGFRVTALAARVRVGTTEIRPRTHMLLRVDLPEGPFVADVGFGGDGPVHPLPLAEGRETWVGRTGHRLRREGDWWVVEECCSISFSSRARSLGTLRSSSLIR